MFKRIYDVFALVIIFGVVISNQNILAYLRLQKLQDKPWLEI
jgi:hypothetical protein